MGTTSQRTLCLTCETITILSAFPSAQHRIIFELGDILLVGGMTRSGHGLFPHEEERVPGDFGVPMATAGSLPIVDRATVLLWWYRVALGKWTMSSVCA
jgi:hypothetical protein